MNTERKPSGIELTTISFGEPYDEYMEWAGYIKPNGTVYLVCSEGVMYSMSDRVAAEIKHGWGTTLEDIVSHINQKEQKIKLEDLIRSFGDRLETNYSICSSNLSH